MLIKLKLFAFIENMFTTKLFFKQFLTLPCVFLFSCQSTKQLGYFQDLNDTSNIHSVQMYPNEPLKLQPDDQVQINISSISPEASQFFNSLSLTPTSGISVNGTGQSFQNVYTINQQGAISLPVLGDLVVGGMTTDQLKFKITELLKDYLKDAVVSVRFNNFKVTVIGDVTRPIVIPVQGERINVLEALGAAGDMTVYGKRYNVKIVRQNNDKLDIAHLNMNSSLAMKSPYFQLRQNDVIYVEPTKSKGLLSEAGIVLIPAITSILTLITVIVTNLIR
jgi:polysaccharide export outer membrane protein